MTTWIAAALIAVTGVPGQTPGKTLLQQIVPNPTGENGYEDYLKAAEILRQPGFSKYLSWTPKRYKELLEASKPDPAFTKDELAEWELYKPTKEVLEEARKMDGMTRLQVWTEATKNYGKALDYLAEGSRKRVWDPRTNVGPTSLYPEYAYMKSVAKFADMAAFVAFSEGKSNFGVKYLLDTYQMGLNLESGALISNLVGTAIEAISLAGIERHLDSISRKDAVTIELAVPQLLSGPPRILASMDYEKKFMLSMLDVVLNSKDPAETKALVGFHDAEQDGGAARKFQAQIDAMTPAQKSALLGRASTQLDLELKPIREMFLKPESAWIPKRSKTTSTTEEEEVSNIPASPSAMVEETVSMSTEVFKSVGLAAAKARTQLRLLGLSASIIRFKWDTGLMPTTLEEAAGKNRLLDPLSGEKFVYERQGFWSFRVYSKGVPETGEIGLKFRKGKDGEQGSSDPVPPRP